VPVIRLGLIGDNIAASQAPDLHHAAARLCGIDVTYVRMVPRDLGLSFDDVVTRAQQDGWRGLNITYPYKERVLKFVRIDDEGVLAIRACNTVLFGEPPVGQNTDYTGYVAAFQNRFGTMKPGVVAVAGSGGAGKAVAFALATLGAKSLALFDTDAGKSYALAAALRQHQSGMAVRVASSLQDACEGADGLINCTPIGMVGHDGDPFDGIELRSRSWICDVVYTPLETTFLKRGRAAGAEILSGYELFLYQGIHAFKLFTGRDVGHAELRRALEGKAD